jgi:hypothetical protein
MAMTFDRTIDARLPYTGMYIKGIIHETDSQSVEAAHNETDVRHNEMKSKIAVTGKSISMR